MKALLDDKARSNFLSYSRRIRSLYIDFCFETTAKVCIDWPVKQLFSEYETVWPKLRELRVVVKNLDDTTPWLLFTKQITQLTIISSAPDYNIALGHISSKTLHLTQIDLRKWYIKDWDDGSFTRRVLSVLQAAPLLEHIGLPFDMVTSQVITALATLPFLKTIKQGPNSEVMQEPTLFQGTLGEDEDREIPITFDPHLPEGSFPQLRGFSFNGTISDAERFIAHTSIIQPNRPLSLMVRLWLYEALSGVSE